jgi:multiple sugar transport system ATP-binding protein
MARIIFENVTKKFGDFIAVKNLNLEIDDREFVCLVGPSGCGKTTSLRMLAGLEEISEGVIKIDENIVNDIPPKDRDIAMVFQSYALYPHYTVHDNLAFGLRSRQKVKSANFILSIMKTLFYGIIAIVFWAFCRYILNLISFLNGNGMLFFWAGLIGTLLMLIMFPESRYDIHNLIISFGAKFFKSIVQFQEEERNIHEKVQETTKLLGIENQLWKKPKQLSGGQRQRVALGRAIIRNPKAFLMDEPLSNLDAKLRVQMRAELQRLTNKLKATTIYVTHDQIEAMTLGDRIVVLNEGIANQIGTPKEVYDTPLNLFVAGFIGSPSMNFVKGKILNKEGEKVFYSESFSYKIPERYLLGIEDFIEKVVILGIRPEHIKLNQNTITMNSLNATIGVLEPIGSDTYVYIDFPEDIEMIVKVEGIASFKIDEEIKVNFLADQLHFFDAETKMRILPEGGMAVIQK